MRSTTTRIIAFLVLAVASAAHAAQTITVAAGDHDRRDVLVGFTPPKDWDESVAGLASHAGADAIPIQFTGDGRALIRLDLKKGETRTLTPTDARRVPRNSAPGVKLGGDDGHVTIHVNGKEVIEYQGRKTPVPDGYDPAFARGGYIHPVYTPSGKLVTDDYPPNHKHHHGIWAPWTKTEFEGRHPDFWNMGEKTGTVEFVELGKTWSGPHAAGFSTKHRFIDLSANPPKAALDETWAVVVHGIPFASSPAHVIDLTITQACASDSSLILPKYYYGGLGFRGNRLWDGGPDKCRYLTSEGKDRSNGNETTGRWCHLGGKVEEGGDALAGVAVLSHPDNFRFPQPMRLHPTEPFFCFAPSQGGDWRIEPGKPYVARYRFIVAEGAVNKDEIERVWNDYAHPPRVEVK